MVETMTETMADPNKWTIDYELKNVFIKVRFLDKLMPDVTLASAKTLFYMIIKLQSTIKCTTKSFSHLVLAIS